MKHYFFLLFILFPVLAVAQHAGHHFNPTELRVKMEEQIKQQACLTDEEAARVFPIMHELREKQRTLNNEASRLKRDFKEDGTDMEATVAITRLSFIKMEGARLEQTYIDKLCKAIPAAKVLRVLKAEDKFHREMLKRMGTRGQQGGGHKQHPAK